MSTFTHYIRLLDLKLYVIRHVQGAWAGEGLGTRLMLMCYLQVTRLTNFLSFVICVPIRVSVDVLYCITTEEDHRSVVETFG